LSDVNMPSTPSVPAALSSTRLQTLRARVNVGFAREHNLPIAAQGGGHGHPLRCG